MLRIFGDSDDVLCVAGDLCGELDALAHVRVVLGDESGGLTIEWTFSDVWGATLAQVGDGVLIPWPVRVETQPAASPGTPPYSVAVCVACPPDTPLRAATRPHAQVPWREVPLRLHPGEPPASPAPPDFAALLDHALHLQTWAEVARNALATAHDGGLCARVIDHRGVLWTIRAGKVYTCDAHGELTPVASPTTFVDTCLDHAGLTFVRLSVLGLGSTLVAFTTSFREGA